MSESTFKFFNVPDKVTVEYPILGLGKQSQFSVLCNISLLFCAYLIHKLQLPIIISAPLYIMIIVLSFIITRLIFNLHSDDVEIKLPDVTQGLILYDNIKHDRISTYDHVAGHKNVSDSAPQRFYCYATIPHICLCDKKKQSKSTTKKAIS